MKWQFLIATLEWNNWSYMGHHAEQIKMAPEDGMHHLEPCVGSVSMASLCFKTNTFRRIKGGRHVSSGEQKKSAHKYIYRYHVQKDVSFLCRPHSTVPYAEVVEAFVNWLNHEIGPVWFLGNKYVMYGAGNQMQTESGRIIDVYSGRSQKPGNQNQYSTKSQGKRVVNR